MLYKILGPKGGLIVRRATAARVKAILPGLRRRFGRVKVIALRPKPKPQPFLMYDAISVANLPRDAAAVAGYVGGYWPTWKDVVRSFPQAKRLSIAVNRHEDAMCLDIESGDASIWQAPVWVRRQQSLGVKRPVLYTSVSQVPGLLSELKRNGIGRGEVRLFTAHYTGRPHRCSPLCHFGFWGRADATQFHNTPKYDVSLCAPDFL